MRILLAKYRIKYTDLHIKAGLTNAEVAKINKDEYLTLQSVERAVKYISEVSKRQIKVDNILTFNDE
jgi:DNA-binding Xre family transcriptional regulator